MRSEAAGVALGAALLALGASAPATAEFFEGRPPYRLLAEDAGLGNLAVRCLLQDRTGFIWVGTENGLYRYDGHEVRAFGREAGLEVPYVVALHETRDGTLYVGLRDGLARREGERFHWYGEGEGLPPVQIYDGAIVSDGSGVVYVATKQGLLVGRGGRFSLEPRPPAVDRLSVTALLVSPRGELFIARGDRLFRRFQSVEEEIGFRLGLPQEGIFGLAMDAVGRLYARGEATLRVLPPRARSFRVDASVSTGKSMVSTMSLDHDGNLLVPTGRGLGRWRGGTGRLLGRRDGLPSENTTAALVDREGSLWVGGDLGVAQQLGSGELTSYGLGEGLSHELVWSITRQKGRDGQPGALWIGTQEGLNRLDPLSGAIREWRAGSGTPSPYVLTVAADEDGGVFASLWPGVVRLGKDGAVPRHYRAQGVPDSDFNVVTLHARPNREVWAATHSWVYRLPPGGEAFEPVPALPAGSPRLHVRDFAEGADGTLLAAGDAGLYRLTGAHPRVFTAANGLWSTAIDTIVGLPDGEFVVAYKDIRGVSRLRLDGERVVLLPAAGTDGLASPNVMFVRKDAAANLWVGTDKGLDVYYRDGSHAHMGRGDGLVTEDTSQNAFHADPDGTVWIGTSRGLVRIRGRTSAPVPEPPPIVLTSVRAGRRELKLGESARLDPQERTLHLSWAGLTFRNPGSVRYRYRLVGLEHELVETRLHEVRYPALGPGRYRFEVTALAATGAMSAAPAVFSFEVQHLWWELAFVRAAGVLAVAMAAAGFTHVRYRRLMARRTLAAREQLRALRAQLNPHFLFNILHSLTLLVHEDAASAEEALDHLAAMLRYVLDDRAGDEVELAEELAFVDHYLALEALRLGPRLRVSREVDAELLDAPIPPFTLQLLVENAIRHGVAKLPEGGSVSLLVRKDGARALALVVRDDGPGASLPATLGARGLGLRALRQRLETRYAGRATLDLATAPGRGFTATIRLPLEPPATRPGAEA